MAFSMAGSKRINQNSESPGPYIGIPWMTDMIWAELGALSKVAPFTQENLLDHIKENPVYWNQLFDNKHISFSDLPNRALINIRQFFDEPLPLIPSTGKESFENKALIEDIKILEEDEEKAQVKPKKVTIKDRKQSHLQMLTTKDSKPIEAGAPQTAKS